MYANSFSSIEDESILNISNSVNNNIMNQDPVKQMFTAITKALRTQSNSIRDLTRKLENTASKQNVDQDQVELLSRFCKNELIISEISGQLQEKSDQQTIEKELAILREEIRNLHEISRRQNLQLVEMADKNIQLEKSIMDNKSLNLMAIETLKSYYDTEVSSLVSKIFIDIF